MLSYIVISIFIFGLGLMVFNATFNNIWFISWWSVLLEWVSGKKPPTCHKSL